MIHEQYVDVHTHEVINRIYYYIQRILTMILLIALSALLYAFQMKLNLGVSFDFC